MYHRDGRGPLHPSPVPAWRSDGAHDGDRRPTVMDWKDLPAVVARFRRYRDAAAPGERPYLDLILGALEWIDPETFASGDDPEEAILNAVLEFVRRDDRGRALARALPPCPRT